MTLASCTNCARDRKPTVFCDGNAATQSQPPSVRYTTCHSLRPSEMAGNRLLRSIVDSRATIFFAT